MQASISWISTLKLHIAIIALMTLARRWLCWTEWQIHRFLDIYNLHPQKSSLEPQVKHSDLKAQVLYRLEEFEQCYGVYKDLIKSTDDKYDTERMTNLSAVTANMADKSKMVVDCEDTFEQMYITPLQGTFWPNHCFHQVQRGMQPCSSRRAWKGRGCFKEGRGGGQEVLAGGG